MKIKCLILFLCLLLVNRSGNLLARQSAPHTISFDFYGDPVSFVYENDQPIVLSNPISEQSAQLFYEQMLTTDYKPVVTALLSYKEQHKPDDWLFYQLIRRTAQQISPKADDYIRYTLYKWFFLTATGYDAILTQSGNRMLFYVQSDELIYNIPSRMQDGKQYICLNFHDYTGIDLDKDGFSPITLPVAGPLRGFSYKVTQLPDFSTASYQEKDIHFNYYENDYHFKVKLNPQVNTIFANYPVTDYEYYFNIPMSKGTYASLIPLLKKNTKDMSLKKGVDYLMRFTRYAFLFQPDTEHFGTEKRLSPEQTLLYDQSDCEDRAALFFYLVKEIYNVPMLVLAYPKHVTIAVQFDKPVGKPIVYNGRTYSICEPTPQDEDLSLGETLPRLRKTPYEVAYSYIPHQ